MAFFFYFLFINFLYSLSSVSFTDPIIFIQLLL
nr:MAG TPA: hypothetical protein [Caudoviricetes sp.]